MQATYSCTDGEQVPVSCLDAAVEKKASEHIPKRQMSVFVLNIIVQILFVSVST